jgi:hypothetical protein
VDVISPPFLSLWDYRRYCLSNRESKNRMLFAFKIEEQELFLRASSLSLILNLDSDLLLRPYANVALPRTHL